MWCLAIHATLLDFIYPDWRQSRIATQTKCPYTFLKTLFFLISVFMPNKNTFKKFKKTISLVSLVEYAFTAILTIFFFYLSIFCRLILLMSVFSF